MGCVRTVGWVGGANPAYVPSWLRRITRPNFDVATLLRLRERGARRDPQLEGIRVAIVDPLDTRTLAEGGAGTFDARDAIGTGARGIYDRGPRPDVRRGLALAQRG